MPPFPVGDGVRASDQQKRLVNSEHCGWDSFVCNISELCSVSGVMGLRSPSAHTGCDKMWVWVVLILAASVSVVL